MSTNAYPARNIYLPSNNDAIKLMKQLVFMSSVLLIAVGLFMIAGWFFALVGAKAFDVSFFNLPAGVGIIAGCMGLIASSKVKTRLFVPSLLRVILGLSGSGLLVLIGVFTLYNNLFLRLIMPVFSLSISNTTSITFILTGLSLLLVYVKIPNRFHYSQILVLIAIFLNSYTFLNSLYIVISPTFNSTGGVIPSILISLILIIFCQAFLLAKPDRGFCGLFTMDSLSSKLALRSFFYIVAVPPVLGGVVILSQQLKLYDIYGTITLMVISLTFVYIVITWLNTKFLYHLEQESYLMKEALRVNSISLELSAQDLTNKLSETERSKKEVEGKLNNSLSLSDLVGNQD